jgi:hypothetical protein
MSPSGNREKCISLSSNLTVRSVSVTHENILKSLDENDIVSLDIIDDSQVDISFIQLVEAARIYASTSGKQFTLSRPASGAMLDTLRRGGFLEGMSAEDTHFWLHQREIQ